ncbi:MAG: hypothetical protein AAF600_07255 [Bacteroidota bacterium]
MGVEEKYRTIIQKLDAYNLGRLNKQDIEDISDQDIQAARKFAMQEALNDYFPEKWKKSLNQRL